MLFRSPGAVRTVLVGGGGDGLCVRRLLRFEEIERAVVIELDDEISALARRPPLAELNERSLFDARVELVLRDFDEYTASCTRRFDLIVCDLPAPRAHPLERLYAKPLYERLRDRLAPGGLLSVAVPFLPQTFAFVHAVLREVFPCVYPYRCPMQSRGMAGFFLAAQQPIVRRRSVPGWCAFLNEQVVPTLFALAKDEWHFLGRSRHANAVQAWRDDYGQPLEAQDEQAGVGGQAQRAEEWDEWEEWDGDEAEDEDGRADSSS